MRADRTLAKWALAVAAGAALGACTTQVQPSGSPAPSVAPTEAPAATQATLPPPSQPPSTPCWTRADLAAMPLADIAAAAALCFDAENGPQTTIPQAQLIEVIRTFVQDPSRLAGFRELTVMANSPGGGLRVARFEDDRGAFYLVAVVAGKVLEMNVNPPEPQAGGPVLAQEDLQVMAEELIRREFPAFDELRDRLTFEAGAKSGGVNFFRWELPSTDNNTDMPPLAQVGITDSGEIFSYINTLYFFR